MKKIFTLAFALYFAAVGAYMFFEPELLEAADDTTAVSLTVTSEITVACDATAALTGAGINSISGGSATGSFSCSVTTPDPSGYNLKVKENQKLLTGAGGANNQFDNYTTNSPLDWEWDTPDAGAEVFGFSLDADTVSPKQAYKTDQVDSCNDAGGSVTDNYCWNGFTTEDQEVANKASAASAEVTKFNLKAEAGGSNALVPGDYSNTITATAAVNP